MTKQKQMTEKELDQVSGGPHYSDFNGRTGVMEKRSKRKLRCQLFGFVQSGFVEA